MARKCLEHGEKMVREVSRECSEKHGPKMAKKNKIQCLEKAKLEKGARTIGKDRFPPEV